jgi:virginiamycin A acetyltransferase
MVNFIKSRVRTFVRSLLLRFVPELRFVLSTDSNKISWYEILDYSHDCEISKVSRVYSPYHLDQTNVDEYSYIARNSRISMTRIGKFCSIGMNFVCGRGIHPTNGISTSPYFYSNQKQNGASISNVQKFQERKEIVIGNDVFIGMNVTVLDGVRIGDGAVIGAGGVVSKDIPPYAIAVGCPIKIIGYRFNDQVIEQLLRIKWWEKDQEHFKLIETYFFNINEYLKHMKQDRLLNK